MRRVILIVQVLVASMQMGFAEDSKTSPAWTNDWTAFIKTLSKEVGKNSNFEYNVNDAFLGKTVVWTGTVTDIKHPTADNRLRDQFRALLFAGRTIHHLRIRPRRLATSLCHA